MGMPWMYGPRQFDVEAGISSLIQLNVPYRGTLRSFSLQAAGGGGGSFEVYTSEDAARRAVAEGNGSSESDPDAIPAANYVLHSGTLISGVSVDRELSLPYVNRDGTPSEGVSRLWMRLTPAGAGELQFVIGLAIETIEL